MLRFALTSLFLLGLLRSAFAQEFDRAPLTIDIDGRTLTWQVELADDDRERSRGLMFRTQMDAMTGMLFRFEATRPVTMWMRNTFLPLDMIFADDAGTITHIHRGAVPQSLDIISSRGDVRYVLELNAGEAAAVGLKRGQRMVHAAIPVQ